MWDKPRKHPRVDVSLEVVWAGTSGKHDARISDISFGGCYIDAREQVSIGDIVVFKVHLPTGHWIQLSGEVAHYMPGVGIGLRFTGLTEKERILIEQVIVAHGGEPFVEELPVEEVPQPDVEKPSFVLVADDDPAIRHLTSVIIQREGYQVIEARDGREAFNALQTDTYFVAAILDIVMPHVEGLSLVRYMKHEERLRHIPVGIMTAEQDPKLWNDSLSAGAGIFLPKPFTAAQLKFMLHVLLRQNSLNEPPIET